MDPQELQHEIEVLKAEVSKLNSQLEATAFYRKADIDGAVKHATYLAESFIRDGGYVDLAQTALERGRYHVVKCQLDYLTDALSKFGGQLTKEHIKP